MTEITSSAKIQPRHLDRLAVVYVRQSHPQQQIKHPESAATQRRFSERIEQWGWPKDRIRVLDGDLGKSGTSTVGREDFAWLISEVTLNHVGLVAGFQVNRLAREDETICHLIRICSLFDTLLADQDGLYHPQDFNDRPVRRRSCNAGWGRSEDLAVGRPSRPSAAKDGLEGRPTDLLRLECALK